MSIQVLALLRSPLHGLMAFVIAVVFGTAFLYLNNFLFFTPYITLYLPQEEFGLLALDLAISVLSGISIATSVPQIRNASRTKAKGTASTVGLMAAIFAGACPCYYLFPLVAVAGGVGGALGAIGILFNNYQVPIKLLSLAILAVGVYSLERGFRQSCRVEVLGPDKELSA